MLVLLQGQSLTFDKSSLSFAAPNAAVQYVTITNGAAPYTPTSGNPSIVAPSMYSSNVIAVSPAGLYGNTQITVTDVNGLTGYISISVASGITSPTPSTVFAAVYQGKSPSAYLLQILNVESYSYQVTQVGGLGQATLTVNLPYENAGNLLAPNMVTIHTYEGSLTANVTDYKTLQVNVGSRFNVGDDIVVYDGSHYDFAIISSISGNTLTLQTTMANAYGSGANVLVLRYRGMINQVVKDASLKNLQTIQCVGYQNQIYWQIDTSFSTASSAGGNMECGYALHTLLQRNLTGLDAAGNPKSDLSFGPNFVMSSAAGGKNDGQQATQMDFYKNYNRPTQLDAIISDILKVANGNPNGTQYTLTVDVNNNMNFQAMQSNAPTKIVNLIPTTYTTDGHWDSLGGLTVTAEDATAVQNVLYVSYTDAKTQKPMYVVVEDTSGSIPAYGQRAGTVNLGYPSDQASAVQWGQGYLKAYAYPRKSSQAQFICTGSYVWPTDYIEITGFIDGSVERFNPVAIDYAWNSQAPYFFPMTITGQQLIPSALDEENARNLEHATNGQGFTSYLGDRIVQWGCDMPRDSVTNLPIVTNYRPFIGAGAISAVVNFPAGTGPSGDSQVYGVPGVANSYVAVFQVAATILDFVNGNPYIGSAFNQSTYTISYVYCHADGTPLVDANGNPTGFLIYYPGWSASYYIPNGEGLTYFNGTTLHDSQVVELFRVGFAYDGSLSSFTDLRNMAGVHVGHLIGNPQPDQPPVLKGIVGLITDTNAGLTNYDCSFTFTLTTGNPTWLSGIAFYALPLAAGDAPGSTGALMSTPNPPVARWYSQSPPTASGTYQADFKGLTANVVYDLYVAFIDVAWNISTPLYLASSSGSPYDGYNLPGVGESSIVAASVSLGSPTNAHGHSTYPVSFTPTYNFTKGMCSNFRIIAAPTGLNSGALNSYKTMFDTWGVGILNNADLPDSGSPCTINVGNLIQGTAFDLFLFAEGYDGSFTYPTTEDTTPLIQIPGQNMAKLAYPQMPANATFTVSGVTVSVIDIGTENSAFGSSFAGSNNPAVAVSWNLGDSNVPSSDLWGYQMVLLSRVHSASNPTLMSTYQSWMFTPPYFGSGPYSYFFPACPGQSYDIGFAMLDTYGNYTAMEQLYSNYSVPVGTFKVTTMLNNTGNVVPAADDFSITCTPAYPAGQSPQIQYSWPGWTWILADGTTATYTSGYSATTTTDYLNNAIVAGGQYYVSAAYIYGTNGNVTTFFTHGLPTAAAAQSFFGDGKMQLIGSQGPITIPSSSGTTGGAYNPPAGGGTGGKLPIQ